MPRRHPYQPGFDDPLAHWRDYRLAGYWRMARPLAALAWLWAALMVFQQLLYATYIYSIRNLSTQSQWVGLVMTTFAAYTRTVGPVLVIGAELTFFAALLLALWQLHLLRIPGEIAVALLPADVHRFVLREYRRAVYYWLGLLCIAPAATQLLLALGLGSSMPSGWRGSQEEAILSGVAMLVAYPALAELAILMQLRLPAMLNGAWRLLGPAVLFVLVRGGVSMAQVAARDRYQERLTLFDPPFPWYAMGIAALVLGLGVLWVVLRRVNATMPRWYRGI